MNVGTKNGKLVLFLTLLFFSNFFFFFFFSIKFAFVDKPLGCIKSLKRYLFCYIFALINFKNFIAHQIVPRHKYFANLVHIFDVERKKKETKNTRNKKRPREKKVRITLKKKTKKKSRRKGK